MCCAKSDKQKALTLRVSALLFTNQVELFSFFFVFQFSFDIG